MDTFSKASGNTVCHMTAFQAQMHFVASSNKQMVPQYSLKTHRQMQMVFSSSCTVYGNPSKVPIDETHPLSAVSPYGRSKLIIEDMFRDLAASPEGKDWRIILLRYFNPVGAHPSGMWRQQHLTFLLQCWATHDHPPNATWVQFDWRRDETDFDTLASNSMRLRGNSLAL